MIFITYISELLKVNNKLKTWGCQGVLTKPERVRVSIVTITEAFETYRLDCILFPNQSWKTEENHIYAMKSLVKHTGDVQLESLTFDMVRQWKQSMEARRLGNNTMRSYIIKLRVVLKYMHSKGERCLNPDLIPAPQRETRKITFITPQEVKTLIEACDRPGNKHINRLRNKAIVALLFSSGVRVSELCKLNRLDTNEDFFSVVGKGGVLAPSFIDDTAREHIDAYLKKRKDKQSALFVADQKGFPRVTPDGVQCIFQNLQSVTGIEVRPHVMRHSFATDLMRNGADIRYVQQMMHHKSIQTTAQYLHVMDEELHGLHEKYHSKLSVVASGCRDPDREYSERVPPVRSV